MSGTIGFVLVGQSGRDDGVPVVRALLGPGVEVAAKGALDGLSPAELARMAPVPGEHPVVTRLDDGSHVVVSKPALVPRIERCLTELRDASVKVAALMCTGTFPPFAVPEGLLLLRGQQVVDNGVRAACPVGGKVGVLVPLPEQEAFSGGKFRDMGFDVVTAHANPYGSLDDVRAAAAAFRDRDVVVLHCMGYNGDHKRVVREACGRPTLQANALMARLAAEVAGA